MKKLKTALVILILLLLICLGYIGYILYGYFVVDEEYEGIYNEYVSDDTDTADDGNYISPIPYRDIDIDGLLKVNPDFVAWIYYEDGKVDYPVVKEHEDDINGYLHRTFEGQPNSAGCLFIPYDASDDFTDLNTFIYGHNMRNGSMLGSLKLIFRNAKANYKTPYFYVWTKDYEQIMYRVVSMYVVDKDSDYFAVPTDSASYDEYLDMILSAGSLDFLIPFTDGEVQAMEDDSPIITFSVCYGVAGTSNRLLVHGVEVLREDYVR